MHDKIILFDAALLVQKNTMKEVLSNYGLSIKYRATKIESFCFANKEYSIETKSTIQSILYSFRPIRLPVFFTLAIIAITISYRTVPSII